MTEQQGRAEEERIRERRASNMRLNPKELEQKKSVEDICNNLDNLTKQVDQAQRKKIPTPPTRSLSLEKQRRSSDAFKEMAKDPIKVEPRCKTPTTRDILFGLFSRSTDDADDTDDTDPSDEVNEQTKDQHDQHDRHDQQSDSSNTAA